MNPADFNTAAAIVQHQLTEAIPHLTPLIVKFVAPTLQIRTQQPQENPAHLRVITQALRNCREALARLPIQTVTIYGMQGDRTILWKRSIALASILNQQAEKDNRDPYSFNNQWINRAAFPIAVLFGLLVHWTGFDRLLFGVRLWIHEVGHASVAWFSGHQATPLPFGWTNVGEERSVMVYGLFALLWGLLGWVGWKEGKRVSIGIAAIALVIQFGMTWLMPESSFETWLAFGGVGGEFVLSTLLMVAFYIPLPDRWQWEFWRYPTLGLAANTFVGTFSFWHQVKRGTEDIPWGSLLGGEGDAGGDMNRLSDVGWSDLQIVQTYTSLGNLCLWILIGIYVLRLVQLERLGRKY